MPARRQWALQIHMAAVSVLLSVLIWPADETTGGALASEEGWVLAVTLWNISAKEHFAHHARAPLVVERPQGQCAPDVDDSSGKVSGHSSYTCVGRNVVRHSVYAGK